MVRTLTTVTTHIADETTGGTNAYKMYTGNGSIAAGWPAQESWVSFNEMWITNQHLITRSCDLLYKQPNNNAQEMSYLYDAIKQVAHETRVDHRFILAVVMQETKGCVRAASSTAADGTHNPGLLQSFKGTHTCNNDGKVQNPCPQDQILGMIRDGGKLTSTNRHLPLNTNKLLNSCRHKR